MSIGQNTQPASSRSDVPSASLTKERTRSAVEPPNTVERGNTTSPIKMPPNTIRGQPGSIEYPPSPPEQTLSPVEEAPTKDHLSQSKKRPLAEFEEACSSTEESPIDESPLDESLALAKYKDMMRRWVYAKIIRFLENYLADWPLDIEGRLYSSAWVGNKLRSIILSDERRYDWVQLLVYEKFMDCPMLVTDQDLQCVMSTCPWYRFPAKSPSVIKSGYLLYITSWSISVTELDELVLYLQQEEKTFEELRQWKLVVQQQNLTPEDRLTIRYISSCEISDWPHGPFAMKYDEFSKPFAGVLAEFLPAVEKLFPKIAASAETYCVVHRVVPGMGEGKLRRKFTLAALLPLFGCPTLINRYEDSDATREPLEPLCDSSFAALNTNFHYRAIELGIICHDELLFDLQNLFADMGEYVLDDPDMTSTELDVTTKFDTLRVQSTPFLFQGRKTVMVFAGKHMDVNDYNHGRSFFNSESADALLMKEIIQGLAVVENMIASHFELFPYYCLAPGPYREDLRAAEVSISLFQFQQRP